MNSHEKNCPQGLPDAPGAMLSPHFGLEEFEWSGLARHRGLSNRVPPGLMPNLQKLCQQVLEPTRAHFGPIRIVSGYRSPLLNMAMGGKPDSPHLRGEAADIRVHCRPPQYAVWEWMRDNVDYDQLVLVINTRSEEVWIHAALSPECNRREAWVQKLKFH